MQRPARMKNTGLLITFEGSEGCGKSTPAGLPRASRRPSWRPCVMPLELGGFRSQKLAEERMHAIQG